MKNIELIIKTISGETIISVSKKWDPETTEMKYFVVEMTYGIMFTFESISGESWYNIERYVNLTLRGAHCSASMEDISNLIYYEIDNQSNDDPINIDFGLVLELDVNIPEGIRRIAVFYEKSNALAVVMGNSNVLEFVSEALKADREVVLAAVASFGSAFRFAADDLKADREFVLAAVAKNGRALCYAAEELQSDREVVLTAILQDGAALHDAAEEFQSDRAIVLAAVAQSGWALGAIGCARGGLQSDRAIVLAAVAQDGRVLQYVAEELHLDRAIVLTAVAQSGFAALQYAREEFQSDHEVVLTLISQAVIAKYGYELYPVEELQLSDSIIFASYLVGWPFRCSIPYIREEDVEELQPDREENVEELQSDREEDVEELQSDRDVIGFFLYNLRQNIDSLYAEINKRGGPQFVLHAARNFHKLDLSLYPATAWQPPRP